MEKSYGTESGNSKLDASEYSLVNPFVDPELLSSSGSFSACTSTTGSMTGCTAGMQMEVGTGNGERSKLSNAELKKLAKLEKASRRMQRKTTETNVRTGTGNCQGLRMDSGVRTVNATNLSGISLSHTLSHSSGQNTSTGSVSGSTSTTMLNTLGSDHTITFKNSSRLTLPPSLPPSSPLLDTSTPRTSRGDTDKNVALFGHLYGQSRRSSIGNKFKEVHPSVLTLGLKMSCYEICGSNARCLAMLLAFKNVLLSYTTPEGTSLARHLTSHHLSPQIDFLKSCRPLSISMGNAIRYLKDLIIKIDPSTPEMDAKAALIDAIDTFIYERIVYADTVISQTGAGKIRQDDVIVTFAKSSIILKTFLEAWHAGVKFEVIVVDSKPLFEGSHLASELARHGIRVSYTLVSGACHAVARATKVFLGAHAMMGNGCLYSRVGTAIIAMHAKVRHIPVIVCCESLKFTDRVVLDSIVMNEIAPEAEILGVTRVHTDTATTTADHLVQAWTETSNLQVLNIMYDVTPAEYITMVITEYGSLPPSVVPVVFRFFCDVN